MDVMDAPWIREAERDGMPDAPDPTCPVCGRECEAIYSDFCGDAVGCNECLLRWEPGDWWDEHREEE